MGHSVDPFHLDDKDKLSAVIRKRTDATKREIYPLLSRDARFLPGGTRLHFFG